MEYTDKDPDAEKLSVDELQIIFRIFEPGGVRVRRRSLTSVPKGSCPIVESVEK